jgi:hypothetical protein
MEENGPALNGTTTRQVSNVRVYEADWATHGKRAGPIRNIKMLDEEKPRVVIAFPGGAGTANMMKIGREAGVPVVEVK